MKQRWIICPVREGEGTTVNPNIDAHGLSAKDFAEDPDFLEAYMSVAYDITCRGCDGRRVVSPGRTSKLSQSAADRRLAAIEDGDFEAYQVAGDWRYVI